MTDIGLYEAKTKLSALLDRVQRGERFTITKHGAPMAELVPVARPDAEATQRAIDGLQQVRARLAKRGVKMSDLVGPKERLRDLAREGHQY